MSSYAKEVNQSLNELWDAATALHDLVEKAKSLSENARPIIDAIEAHASIIEAIEARWGKDAWERHRRSRGQ
jgi:DNA-binding GntR family transcriptional regulator